MTAPLLTATTKTGQAVHAVVEGFIGRTLCGCQPAFIATHDVALTADGIQHPFRCDKCSREVARIMSETA